MLLCVLLCSYVVDDIDFDHGVAHVVVVVVDVAVAADADIVDGAEADVVGVVAYTRDASIAIVASIVVAAPIVVVVVDVVVVVAYVVVRFAFADDNAYFIVLHI